MIALLNQPWTERLGWTLLHFLWQGILVAALYALARALAGGRISARGRYAIACASLLAMTAAPALTYWWLGNSGQTARIGDLTNWGARQLAPGFAYSPVTDPWQQAMPGIVMAWFVGAAACSLRLLMPGSVDTEFSGHPGKREGDTSWMIAPEDIAEAVVLVLRIPERTTISRIEVRPSRPKK